MEEADIVEVVVADIVVAAVDAVVVAGTEVAEEEEGAVVDAEGVRIVVVAPLGQPSQVAADVGRDYSPGSLLQQSSVQWKEIANSSSAWTTS